jgi:hypothetical protein
MTGAPTPATPISGLTSTRRLPEAAIAWPFGAAMTTIEASNADDRLSASGVRPGREVRGTDPPELGGPRTCGPGQRLVPRSTASASDQLDRTG